MKIHGTFLLVMVLGGLASGCAHQSAPGFVSNGECKFLERPEYAVKGKAQPDQDWIDSTIEGGVGACGWQRPAPRPESAVVKGKKVAPKAAKAKKPGWLSFAHGLRKQPAVAVEAPAEPAAPAPEPEAPPAPALRAIDQLLGKK